LVDPPVHPGLVELLFPGFLAPQEVTDRAELVMNGGELEIEFALNGDDVLIGHRHLI
jgi:hypothetical protein